MRRLIPPKTRQAQTLIAQFNFWDLLVILFFLSQIFLISVTSFPNIVKVSGICIYSIIMIVAETKINETRGYVLLIYMCQYFIRGKKINSFNMHEVTGLDFKGNIILTETDKSMMLEIDGIDFETLSEHNQDYMINQFAYLFKNIQSGTFLKVDEPIDFSSYINQTKKKKSFWEEEYKKDIETPNPKKYSSKIKILSNQEAIFEEIQNNKSVLSSKMYFVIYSIDEDELLTMAHTALECFANMGLNARIIDAAQARETYKIYYNMSTGEDDNLIHPTIEEKFNKLFIDDEAYRIYSIGQLPLYCSNAWAANLFQTPGLKIVLNYDTQVDKSKVYRAISKSIVEKQANASNRLASEDIRIDNINSYEALLFLLEQLKLDNEHLHDIGLYVLFPDVFAKKVNELLSINNIFADHLFFRQLDAYLSMNLFCHEKKKVRGEIKEIQSTSLAACFPFVSRTFRDPEGEYIGYGKSTIMFDIFRARKENLTGRTASNMMVVGTTGSGKSFLLKLLLTQQACNNTKIFVMDPENEYEYESKQLGGNFVDVAGVGFGQINPLQIFPTLKEEEEDFIMGEVSNHVQFLQSFFQMIVPSITFELSTYLNSLIIEVYKDFNITDATKVEDLDPSQFPTMDDLYKKVTTTLEKEQRYDFDRQCLRQLQNILENFRRGGVYARLWNGHTTLKIKDNFTVFNFQSLFANSNKQVTNAQMLLIMRMLMQEVIKNRNLNLKNGTADKVMILVDEAHQFVNPQAPVCLAFLKQMAKQIRKYDGSLVVATQNIKDFVGSNEKIKDDAAGIINNCQYSAILKLAPEDINSLVELYSKSNNNITQSEIDTICNFRRGDALFIMEPSVRIQAHIQALDGIEYFFNQTANNNITNREDR